MCVRREVEWEKMSGAVSFLTAWLAYSDARGQSPYDPKGKLRLGVKVGH